MERSKMFLHPFCFPELERFLLRTEVTEVTPDARLLEGNVGLDFFLAPPSSNICILRDEDLVMVIDSGLHPYYRKKILDVLEEFRRDGARRLVLVVTQGHWDHALNNDVILEAGYEEVNFLLPEPEIRVIESIPHWLADFRSQSFCYEPDWQTWSGLLGQFEEYARQFDEYREERLKAVWAAIDEARRQPNGQTTKVAVKLLGERVLLRNYRSMADFADILPLEGREIWRFGDVELTGWRVGRFYIIHDGAHSPGHICVYDPKYKMIVAGDVTIEVNPAFSDSAMRPLIRIARDFRIMAQQGFIELAVDSHRNRKSFTEIVDLTGLEVLHPLQLADLARGQDECAAFFRVYEDYYQDMMDEALASHARLGEATVSDILEEMRKSENRNVRFKLGMPFPSRPELVVYSALKEYGYSSRRVVGDRILFAPPKIMGFKKLVPVQKWLFCPSSLSDEKNNPRNMNNISLVIFFVLLDLGKTSSFLDRH